MHFQNHAFSPQNKPSAVDAARFELVIRLLAE